MGCGALPLRPWRDMGLRHKTPGLVGDARKLGKEQVHEAGIHLPLLPLSRYGGAPKLLPALLQLGTEGNGCAGCQTWLGGQWQWLFPFKCLPPSSTCLFPAPLRCPPLARSRHWMEDLIHHYHCSWLDLIPCAAVPRVGAALGTVVVVKEFLFPAPAPGHQRPWGEGGRGSGKEPVQQDETHWLVLLSTDKPSILCGCSLQLVVREGQQQHGDSVAPTWISS